MKHENKTEINSDYPYRSPEIFICDTNIGSHEWIVNSVTVGLVSDKISEHP